MHGPLGIQERQDCDDTILRPTSRADTLACAEYIAAIEECHARGMLARWTGVCNEQKTALNMCLRQERIDRTSRNRDEAKERTAKRRALFAEMDREMAEIKEAEQRVKGDASAASASA